MRMRALVLGSSLLIACCTLVSVPAGAKSSAHHPDFNNDGYADLVVPVPGEGIAGKVRAGALHVFYGSMFGPLASGSDFISQAAPGAAGSPGADELFGFFFTWGDFDGDGYDDLAAAVLREHVAGMTPGAVQVFYGSAGGLTTTRDRLFSEASPGMPGAPQVDDQFGRALAAGDFDGDGYDDLAIGNPGEAWGGGSGYGTAYVLYGASAGLSTTGAQRINQETAGVAGASEDGDLFGMAVAAGDFDGDGNDDLAIGAPGETLGGYANAGVVHVVHGADAGLKGVGSEVWGQGSAGVAGTVQSDDAFGAALASGHFDGGGRGDLAIGVLGDAVAGISQAGSVEVLRGSAGGLTAAGSRLLSFSAAGVPGAPVSGDVFGIDVAGGDFNGDGHDDLAVAVPARDVDGVSNAGAVVTFEGGSGVVPLPGAPRVWSQGSPGIVDTPETFDLFGSELAVGDFNGNGRDDLFVGVAMEDFSGKFDAGAGHVIFGRAGGLSSSGSQRWTQNSPGVPGGAEDQDMFGASIPL